MPRLDDWEQWIRQIVNEVQDWLHSRDSNIDIAPLESRNDTRLGLNWPGTPTNLSNLVCYNRLVKEFRVELYLSSRGLASQHGKELRDAGLDSWYTDSNKRLNIPLTAATFERHKSLLKRLVDTAYDQAI